MKNENFFFQIFPKRKKKNKLIEMVEKNESFKKKKISKNNPKKIQKKERN